MATFLPDGTCREDVTLVFKLKNTRPVYLKLRGLTGSVAVSTTP